MKVVQLIWGGFIVCCFLMSGVYMSETLDPESDLSLVSMTFRANHIYWLMSGLLVITWAQRATLSDLTLCTWMNRCAGLFVCIAPVFFGLGFVLEAGQVDSQRLWTFYGVIIVFAGVILSFLSTLIDILVRRQLE